MSKRYIISIVVLVIIVLTAGYLWQKSHRQPGSGKVLADKQNNLSDSDKKLYQDRISKAEAYLKSINPQQGGGTLEISNTYVYLGQQYFGLGQLEQSKQMYQKALTYNPSNDGAVEALATTYLAAGDKTDAQQTLEVFLKKITNNQIVWLQYIDLLTSNGATKQDLEAAYQKALANTSNNIDVLTRYAEFEEKIGNLAQALNLWQQALQQDSRNSAIYQPQIDRLKALSKQPSK